MAGDRPCVQTAWLVHQVPKGFCSGPHLLLLIGTGVRNVWEVVGKPKLSQKELNKPGSHTVVITGRREWGKGSVPV